jgi:hypothetical protein
MPGLEPGSWGVPPNKPSANREKGCTNYLKLPDFPEHQEWATMYRNPSQKSICISVPPVRGASVEDQPTFPARLCVSVLCSAGNKLRSGICGVGLKRGL